MGNSNKEKRYHEPERKKKSTPEKKKKPKKQTHTFELTLQQLTVASSLFQNLIQQISVSYFRKKNVAFAAESRIAKTLSDG